METTTPLDLDALNAVHALADRLRFVPGPGGWPLIEVHGPEANALVSLYGGQVLSFQPADAGTEVLFLSEHAQYQPGKAIRGGVPICWPWFGPDPLALVRPSHGLARTRLWAVLETGTTPTGEIRITLGLNETPETRAVWPHAFELRLDIVVGPSLRLSLSTRNTGDRPFTLTQALHSYFAVGDIAQTTVTGLDGCRYADKAAGADGAEKMQTGVVRIDAEVDRVYANPPPVLTVVDGAGQREVSIASEGSRSAVVWNPWADLSARMADLDDQAYRRFVCVETANAGDDRVTVAPGESQVIVAVIGVHSPIR
jgi:glucose-6-phosphate 1-epimerase